MLGEIRISELQFHLRNENCKVYPVTINELPFYLCLKQGEREIYDAYFEHISQVCPHDFTGNKQDYEYYVDLYENIKTNGWDKKEGVFISRNPTGKWGKTIKTHVASDGGKYLVTDAMHRLSILFYLYGDISLGFVAQSGRNRGYYKPITRDMG